MWGLCLAGGRELYEKGQLENSQVTTSCKRLLLVLAWPIARMAMEVAMYVSCIASETSRKSTSIKCLRQAMEKENQGSIQVHLTGAIRSRVAAALLCIAQCEAEA